MSVKFNRTYLQTTNGFKEIFHSFNVNAEYSGSGATLTYTQWFEMFDVGDGMFNVSSYVDTNGSLRSGHTAGEVICTLPNGNTIRLYYNDTESAPYYINAGFEFYYANNTLFGGISNNYYQISTQKYRQFYFLQLCTKDNKIYAARYPYAPWSGESSAYMSYDANLLDMTDFFGSSPVLLEDPYGTEINDTEPGGFANFDYSGDDVDVPLLPAISASACGFVGLYNPTLAEMRTLAEYLWSGAFDISTYRKLFNDPMDCILSIGIIPFTPDRSDNKEAVYFGNQLISTITAYKIPNQFAEVDCGSLTVSGDKFTKSAMDYSPYTRMELFLPYCGTHSVSADDFMDSTISIKYRIDIYTGACVAYVKVAKTNSDGSDLDSVLYQFTGNVLTTIPITSADHSQFIQSILFMGAAAAATVATAGGAAPEIGGAMAVGDSVSTSALGGAAISASGINAVMSMKPNVMRSGNLSSNAGLLGLQKPVLTITAPNLCRPEDENKLAGMPCQKSGTLSDFTGFNIVGACHLDNIPCTQTELRMIDEALAKGVII